MVKKSVLILGDGVAASACAIALSELGCSVTLISRQVTQPTALSIGEHMSPEARLQLVRLGLGDLSEAPEHRVSMGVICHFGTAAAYTRDYVSNPNGTALNLERHAFDMTLRRKALDGGAERVEMTRLIALHRVRQHWELKLDTLNGPMHLQGNILVDATGRAAVLSRWFGIGVLRYDRLVGLHARLDGNHYRDGRLIVEAMEDGWWYSVPLSSGRLVAAYLTDSDLLPSGADALRQFWQARLRESAATGSRIGRMAEPPLVRVAAAYSQCTNTHAGNGWLAIGDASMAFDPLAAAGITKALADGLGAAERINSAFEDGHLGAEQYDHDRVRVFSGYLRRLRDTYRQERRFSTSPFWQRRHQSDGSALRRVGTPHYPL